MIDRVPASHDAGLAAFAHAWAVRLAAATYVPIPWAERLEVLGRMTARLAAAVTAEHLDVAAGHRLGADLAQSGFTAPEAIARTLTVIHERLLGDLGLSGEAVRLRLIQVVEALTVGYAWALRDLALDGQEAMRWAETDARQRAERELRAAQAALQHAALHDSLTGLPLRLVLIDRLEQLAARAEPGDRFGLCLLDLDSFKAINDSLGQQVGDRLLVMVADRLASFAVDEECLLVRLDGDEFAVLVEGTTCAEDATKIADRALHVLAEPVHLEGQSMPVPASVGVVEGPLAGADPEEAMRAAILSLHWSQTDGGARWTLFNAERNELHLARYRLSAAMPEALATDQFTVDYQPLVDLATSRIAGFEALARWHHPDLGILTPSSFIDLAEQTGLIVPLGQRLLEQACRDAVGWPAGSSTAPYLSFNLAARQLHDPGLIGDIAAILHDTGLPPDRLQLEITEGTACHNAHDTIAVLAGLAELGVRLAIDDFGTGYANHVYMRTLPIHGLKLDASFVRDLDEPAVDPRHAEILANLISLGHILDLTVTAEGIETAEQADRLRSMGCDLGQGWEFGRPAGAAATIELVRDRNG